MAQAKVTQQELVLTLTLSPEEAERFKAMMQNEWFSGEGAVVKDLRQSIWEALDDAGVASL